MAGRPPSKEAPPFGRRLAAARKARGFSQAELAKKLRISRAMVEYYERRAVNPALEFVRHAADVLGVPVLQLVADDAPRASRGKPGPKSRLDEKLEAVKALPKKDQEFVMRVLDSVLEGAGR